ncbi:MAG: hypothetical protein ACHP79_05080 [Terriglobales bacterium]
MYYLNQLPTIVIAYMVYILISVNLTIWVARTLHKRGAIFLVDAFHGNAELAGSVNHLLVVGFYLINIGFVSLAMKTEGVITNSRAAFEMLGDKLGVVLLVLGAMHFFNLVIFSVIRGKARDHAPRRPPVAPDATLRISVPPPPVPASR